MYFFVEEKIKKAVDNGEFDHLPGMGKPLNLKDDLPGLSEDLKMTYRILKNGGFISEQVEQKGNITFHNLMSQATEGEKIDQTKMQKYDEYMELTRNRKWHKNSTFATYAKKIYEKLF